jgi:triosephosphate isomerase
MPYIIGNWKMNLDIERAMELAGDVADMANDASEDVGVGVAIPYPWIPLIASEYAESSLLVGAQDASPHVEGAHTGDVSAGMLAPWCTFAIVGHSERRQYHGETDELVRAKVDAVLANQLAPVLCVGESRAERDSGRALDVIAAQVNAAISHLDATQLRGLLVAYEPVWAIGTGLTASPADAQEVATHIRAQLREIDDTAAGMVPILYGGSVKGDNAASFLAEADIDGALVGGASLDAGSFLEIIRGALA